MAKATRLRLSSFFFISSVCRGCSLSRFSPELHIALRDARVGGGVCTQRVAAAEAARAGEVREECAAKPETGQGGTCIGGRTDCKAGLQMRYDAG